MLRVDGNEFVEISNSTPNENSFRVEHSSSTQTHDDSFENQSNQKDEPPEVMNIGYDVNGVKMTVNGGILIDFLI